MAKRPTPFLVNAALHDAGLPYEIVRNRLGGSYYYFVGLDSSGCPDIPSFYQYTLEGLTYDDIVNHVRKHHDQWLEDRAVYGLSRSRFVSTRGEL